MSQARRPLIAGNWKMFKTRAETSAYIAALRSREPLPTDVDAVLCPPFTALATAQAALDGSSVALGAQTMAAEENGAFTGEISPLMLRDVGVRFVILGHSERRRDNGESDAAINRKIVAALAHGMTPIVAVGETAQEHAAGQTTARVVAQTQAAFAGRSAAEVAQCVVAYEPIWAIGSGNADTPEGANAVMAAIRAALPGLEHARLLYGGSVKPENIAALLAQPHIDGALVGGASLDPTSFAALLAHVSERRDPSGNANVDGALRSQSNVTT